MGLSIVASGAIMSIALFSILFAMPNIVDKLVSISEINSQTSELDEAIFRTNTQMTSLRASSGDDFVRFNLAENGTEKLWNYEDFTVLVTYDANLGGTPTKVTEEFAFNRTASFRPIEVDNVTPFIGICDPCNFDHVIGAGSDQIIIVAVSYKDGGHTVSGVTHDGLALSPIRSDVQPLSTSESSLWYRIAPSTTGDQVSVDLSSAQDVVVGAISLNNVYQADPMGADNGNDGTDDTPTVSVTTTFSNSWVVDVVDTFAGPMTAGAGQTERWDTIQSSTRGAGSTEVTTTFGSYTMSWTNTAGSNNWVISAAEIKPLLADVGEWQINSIQTDIIDPRIINNDEAAEIIIRLANNISTNGEVIVSVSTDNGVTATSAITAT